MTNDRLWSTVRSALEARLHDVHRTIVDRVLACGSASNVAGSPPDRGDWLAGSVVWALSRGIDYARYDRPYSEDDFGVFRSQGTQLAALALPSAEFEFAYSAGTIAVHRELWGLADERNFRLLDRVAGWYAREVPKGIEMALLAHGSAIADVGDHSRWRGLLVRQLLRGAPVTAEMASLGPLPISYLIVVIANEDIATVDSAPAGRLRALVEAEPGVLYRIESGEAVVLIPVSDTVEAARMAAGQLMDRLVQRADKPFHAAFAHRPTLKAIPDAMSEAEAALALARMIPDPPGRLHQLDGLLVEATIAQSPVLARRLANILTPLSKGVALLETLQTLFACDFEFKRTARTMHIHTRTLAYRLGRIGELVGIDPKSVHGMQLLRSALFADRVTRSESKVIVDILSLPGV